MSSDVIKHMAAKILSAIKEQNVEYYKDTAKKEQLVRIILSKIDKYSDKINSQNINKIATIITKEISQEYHPDKKTKVSYPQKQSSDFFEPFNNSMSSLQFERNNVDTITKGRGSMMSNRPVSSLSSSSSSKMNRQQSSTFRDNFMPIQNGYQQQHQQNQNQNQYVDGTKEDVSKNYEKLLAERQTDFNGINQRPETPDFSLDGSGKKKKEQNNQQQYQQHSQHSQHSQHNQHNKSQYQQPQYQQPYQEYVAQQVAKKKQPLDPALKNSFLYNKYFKDYKDVAVQPEIRVPKTIEEYKNMLLEDRLKRIEQKKRIAEIKSTKLLFTTSTSTSNQNIINSTKNNLRSMNFHT